MSPRVYKPWEITDEMINKIPKIDYYGLTKEQSEELNIIVKKTLQEVRNDNIDRNKYIEISKEIIDSYNNVPVDNDVFLVDLLNNCEKFGVRFFREV